MQRFLHVIHIVLTFSSISFSQNIFDLEHSAIYADYLYKTGDYSSATKEYERLLLLAPDISVFAYKLLQSYKHTKQIDKGIEKSIEIFGTLSDEYPRDIIHIYMQFLILKDNYPECNKILKEQTKLTKQEHQEISLALYLLENNKDSAEALINNTFCSKIEIKEDSISNKFSQLTNLYYNQQKANYKKPLVASLLSTVIPGLGKIYANDIKNGLGVLSVIGLYSWQSYRGFKHEGLKSFYGWGFGALATGFYIGNVYGAHQSAIRENEYQGRIIEKKVKDIMTKD